MSLHAHFVFISLPTCKRVFLCTAYRSSATIARCCALSVFRVLYVIQRSGYDLKMMSKSIPTSYAEIAMKSENAFVRPNPLTPTALAISDSEVRLRPFCALCGR